MRGTFPAEDKYSTVPTLWIASKPYPEIYEPPFGEVAMMEAGI